MLKNKEQIRQYDLCKTFHKLTRFLNKGKKVPPVQADKTVIHAKHVKKIRKNRINGPPPSIWFFIAFNYITLSGPDFL